MRTIQHCDRALGTNNTDDDNGNGQATTATDDDNGNGHAQALPGSRGRALAARRRPARVGRSSNSPGEASSGGAEVALHEFNVK